MDHAATVPAVGLWPKVCWVWQPRNWIMGFFMLCNLVCNLCTTMFFIIFNVRGPL
jgi:hypothetical protein